MTDKMDPGVQVFQKSAKSHREEWVKISDWLEKIGKQNVQFSQSQQFQETDHTCQYLISQYAEEVRIQTSPQSTRMMHIHDQLSILAASSTTAIGPAIVNHSNTCLLVASLAQRLSFKVQNYTACSPRFVDNLR